jgi:hypothetical protein
MFYFIDICCFKSNTYQVFAILAILVVETGQTATKAEQSGRPEKEAKIEYLHQTLHSLNIAHWSQNIKKLKPKKKKKKNGSSIGFVSF